MRAKAWKRKYENKNDKKTIFINIIYKKKVDKIKPMNLNEGTSEKSNKNLN